MAWADQADPNKHGPRRFNEASGDLDVLVDAAAAARLGRADVGPEVPALTVHLESRLAGVAAPAATEFAGVHVVHAGLAGAASREGDRGHRQLRFQRVRPE